MPPRSMQALLTAIQRDPQGWYAGLLGKGSAGQTAAAATYLNYGPQFDALAAILGGAREQRRSGIKSAQRAGQAGAQGITRIRDSYTQGLQDTLGSLGGPVATGAPVASPEARAAQQLGLSGTALSGMLSGMAAQQVAGIGTQSRQLNREFSSRRDEVGSKLTGLLREASGFNTTQYQSLAGERRKAAQEARLAEQRLAADLARAGLNPETGVYDPAYNAPPKPSQPDVNEYGRTDAQWAALSDAERQRIIRQYGKAGREPGSGPKPKPGTPGAATQSEYTQYAKAFSQAKRLVDLTIEADSSLSDRELADTILRDGAVIGINKDGTPKFATSDNAAAVWAAIQLRRHGGVSRRTWNLLGQQGLRPKQLGYELWKPPKRRPSTAPNPFEAFG